MSEEIEVWPDEIRDVDYRGNVLLIDGRIFYRSRIKIVKPSTVEVVPIDEPALDEPQQIG